MRAFSPNVLDSEIHFASGICITHAATLKFSNIVRRAGPEQQDPPAGITNRA